MSTRVSILKLLALVAVLGALPAVLAHGDDEGGMDMDMDMSDPEPQPEGDGSTPSYFTHPEHTGAIYGHIALMVLAWIGVLPIAVMFSIARSRYTLLVQFLFLAINTVGVFLGVFYNTNTPDLYPNNAHHKLGWLVVWVTCAQIAVSLIGRVAGKVGKGSTEQSGNDEQQAFLPVSTEAMAEHHEMYPNPYRHSDDSEHGTESNSGSMHSNSVSTMVGQESPIEGSGFDRRRDYGDDDDDDDDLAFKPAEMTPYKEPKSLVARFSSKISARAWTVIMFAYNFVDRAILMLGSITLATGLITFARFFEGHEIFSGMAHWIKGGVFFWYGIYTLGRWCGSFGDLGWAWNIRPKKSSKKWQPSADFIEGFLFFFYGSTNIFLEHLANADEPFSSQDLEHVSITVLFIGGGLLTMLIESSRIRDLLNTSTTQAVDADMEPESLEVPEHYKFSLNPIPALVILLLGIMMSSHTQHDMTSSMVHKQWGNLLAGASFARTLTYILAYLKPPRSILPSRPPTELLTSFCLISGGAMFMASSEDTVRGMVNFQLDAMFMYTVTLGFVALFMAWIVLVLAFKGWAVRKEAAPARRGWASRV